MRTLLLIFALLGFGVPLLCSAQEPEIDEQAP